MFLLYRVYGSKRNPQGYNKEIVEDDLLTIDDARDAAWESGPGRYVVLSLSKSPGHRTVERINVPAGAFDMSVANS